MNEDVHAAAAQDDVSHCQANGRHDAAAAAEPSSSRIVVTGTAAAASSVSNASQDEEASSSSAAFASEEQRAKKRRRRMEDLGFSSPGPAFFAMSISSDAGSESDAAGTDGGRAQRRARTNGATGLRVASASNGSASQPHVQRPTQRNVRPFLPSGVQNNGSTLANGKGTDAPKKSIFRNWDPSTGKSPKRHHKGKRRGEAESIQPRSSTSAALIDNSSDDDDGDEVAVTPGGRQARTRRASSRMQDYDERFSERQTSPRKQHKDSVSSARRDDGRTASSSAVQRAVVDQASSSDATPRRPSDPRNARIEDLSTARRNEMDDVYKQHDMLVRELFHLRKFVTLFGFDPEVALQDRSDVFERFRMEYDLPTLLSGSKGRATRRLVSAHRGHLALPSAQAASSSSSAASGKGRKGGIHVLPPPSSSPSRTATNGGDGTEHALKRGRRRLSAISVQLTDGESSGDDVEEERPQPKKRGRKSKAELLALQNRQTSLSTRSPSPSIGSDRSTSVVVPKVKRPRGRPPKHTYAPRKPVEVERIEGIPRLRVLRPAHLPSAPKHGRSFAAYLESWRTTGEIIGGDWEIVTDDVLRAREEREAALYSRIDELRSEGLLQSREEALRRSQQNRVREVERKPTPWDAILAKVGPYAAQQRADVRFRAALAKRTARSVQAYWDEKLGRGEKHRKAEERRIRALAKWTVREVRKQWKLAVNVVRAQRAAREKQEKDRVGREQLKSILEQSTQVLGKQQKAMQELGAEKESESDESDLDSVESESGDGGDDESEAALSEEASESDLSVQDGAQANASSSEDDDDDDDDDDLSMSDASDDSDEENSDDDVGFASLSQLLLPRSSKRTTEDTDIALSSPVPGKPEADIQLPGTANDEQAMNVSEELRPVQTTMTTPIVDTSDTSASASQQSAENDEDEDEEDAAEEADDARVDEDAELERKMWEDDQSESDDDEALAAEADMPIEELMKKYGYGDAKKNSESGSEDASGAAGKSRRRRRRRRVSGVVHASEKDAATTEASRSEQEDGDDVGTHDEDMSSAAASLRPSRQRTAASSPAGDASSGVKVKPPFLLRGTLRPYQQIGFEWLVNLYNNGSNGILADEMGLGKTIQTISLLGHLACDKGVWGPHLVVAPTSVMLNWEVEFKKFLPGFKILSYYGTQRERKEKRKGWDTENSFNVCITSYQLILADQHILRRKAWKYLVLDEAHHIKNFRSQRWQTLLGFNSQRRLLLTGTPLQNNLMDLWSLMYFLMPNGVTSAEGVVNSGFASMKEFQQWFSNPLDRAVESAGMGTASEEMDNETKGMVSKLHTLLRPYLLRRLKSEVEKEMPAKFEHVIKCRLSKRQQFLYNDFMSRAKTRESLASGNYLSIINCLMQLRKVCNHPDLFEQRPIVTSFAMDRSAVAEYEIKELLVRRTLLDTDAAAAESQVDLDVLNLRFNTTSRAHLTPIVTRSLKQLDASDKLPHVHDAAPQAGPIDTWTLNGYKQSMALKRDAMRVARWQHVADLNRLRCQRTTPHLFDTDSLELLGKLGPGRRLYPFSVVGEDRRTFLDRCDAVHRAVLGPEDRRTAVQGFIDRFAFVTPRAVSTDMHKWALPGLDYDTIPREALAENFDTLHAPAVKLQIAFPDASLLQYDCGKLQELAKLMDQCKYGTHRILIFTQMTKILDILEIWLNFNGFNYLRLDGQTKIEDRQALTEKFNRDDRIKAFILSTRSGGLGINLTGADMVLFWDLDWNFQIEAQCMDRAHRIGQTRDVHIYRFVSEHTIEENMLKKSHEKRLLDAMVIQDGQFTTEGLSKMSWIESMFDEGSRSIAGVRVGGGGESEDAIGAAAPDRRIEMAMDAAEDEEDAQAARTARAEIHVIDDEFADEMDMQSQQKDADVAAGDESLAAKGAVDGDDGVDAEDVVFEEGNGEEEEEGGTVDDYMLRRVDADWEFFSTV